MNSLQILNQEVGDNEEKEAKTNGDISARLQKLMLEIKGDFMSREGEGVDYNELRKSEVFVRYTKECTGLHKVDLGTLGDEEKQAFFINIYNALTIHGICTSGVPTSVLEIKNFWKSMAYSIGGHVFTLDDIEHGILRGNRPHPSSPSPLFSEQDARLQYSLSKVDQRVHFTLVCGAKSCPAINIYSAKNLERGLIAATKNFCSQEVDVELTTKQVKLSKLFLWYKTDFGSSDEEVLRWILPYLSGQTYQDLEILLSDCKQISINYFDYNWNLNNISVNL